MPLLCPHLGFWQDLHTGGALLFAFMVSSVLTCQVLGIASCIVSCSCTTEQINMQMVERRLVQPENFVQPYVKLESCIVSYHTFLSRWKCTKNDPFKVTMNSYCLGHVNKLFFKLTCWPRHEWLHIIVKRIGWSITVACYLAFSLESS